MPDGEEVVMIMTARSIHEARPGFWSQFGACVWL